MSSPEVLLKKLRRDLNNVTIGKITFHTIFGLRENFCKLFQVCNGLKEEQIQQLAECSVAYIECIQSCVENNCVVAMQFENLKRCIQTVWGLTDGISFSAIPLPASESLAPSPVSSQAKDSLNAEALIQLKVQTRAEKDKRRQEREQKRKEKRKEREQRAEIMQTDAMIKEPLAHVQWPPVPQPAGKSILYFRLAELKKENGDQLFKIKQYRSALPLYTEAIELCPETAAYYGNRAACYMMLNNYREALEDARKAVQLDQAFIEGYQHIIKCSIALGDTMTADQAVKKVAEMDPQNTSINAEVRSLEILKQYEGEAIKAYDKKHYRKVVHRMDRCLDQAPTCARYKITKAECLAFLGRYQEAQEIADSILHIDRGNADAIYVRGICLFYADNIDNAVSHFQQVLRLAPDHKKAMETYKRAKALKKKKDDGNEAYKNCKFQEAINLYTEALEIDPLNKKTNSKLHFKRATVLARLTKLKEAVADCSAALNLNDTYLKALLRRAKCYMRLSEYEDAVRDYEKACKMDESRENKMLLQDAKLALKRSKRKDYYKILAVDRTATDDEFKKAYRKRTPTGTQTPAMRKRRSRRSSRRWAKRTAFCRPLERKLGMTAGKIWMILMPGMHADIDPT